MKNNKDLKGVASKVLIIEDEDALASVLLAKFKLEKFD